MSTSSSWRELFPYWDVPKTVPAMLADVLATGPRDAAELEFARAVEAAPKVEVHVHLEAAVPASFYAQLNERRRLFAPDALPASRAPFPTFRDFIAAWIDNTRLVDAEHLFQEMGRAFVEQRHKQNIVYSEAHISPIDFSLGRARFKLAPEILDFRLALENMLAGLQQGLSAYPDVDARLIVDTLWISEPDECRTMLAALRAVKQSGLDRHPRSGEPLLVAIGMGGPEVVVHAESKRAFVADCRQLGLKLDIHSGENTKAEEHRHAVTTLLPDRIGHGIAGANALPDGAAPWFFDGPIGACPLSNILTGSFRGSMAQHPVRLMRERGVRFSVNSDDPLLFGNTLTLEFVALRRALGWGMDFFAEAQSAARAMTLTDAGKRA